MTFNISFNSKQSQREQNDKAAVEARIESKGKLFANCKFGGITEEQSQKAYLRKIMKPLPLRDEALSGYEPRAWKPNWNCFCCHDTGIVSCRLVKTVMPDYVPSRHKPVECNATHCSVQLAELLYQTQTLDRRFTSVLCDRLDKKERQMWREWRREQHHKRQAKLMSIETNNLTRNLRNTSRRNCEQLEIQRRHQSIKHEY